MRHGFRAPFNVPGRRLTSLICSVSLLGAALAQELPMLYPEPMSNISSYRQNVCDRSIMFSRGEIELRDALKGLSLKPGLQLDRFIQMDPETGGIPEEDPGIEIEIMDELAKRAGFTWRESFAIFDPPILEKGQTWTDLLVWSAKNFDLTLKWWNQNEIRLGMGVIYPEGWFDASIIMIVQDKSESTNEMNLAGWMQPFHVSVWLLIIATVIISGIVYKLVQLIDDYHSSDDENESWVGLVYKSAMSFVGHAEFSPSTNAARLLAVSMGFWSVLILSAYTANFVKFLVKDAGPEMNFESLHDAVAAGVPMCIMATSAMDVAVSSAFQKINLLRVPTEKDVFLSLLAGDCSIALSTASAWSEYERNSEINSECNLRWMGRAFKIQQGHFAAYSDSGNLCTNLIRDVVNIHMIEMRADGFLDRAWDYYLDSIADMNCNLAKDSASKDSAQLDLNDMMGNFLVHFVVMAFSVIWATWSRYRRRSKLLSKSAAMISQKMQSVRDLTVFTRTPSKMNLEAGTSSENAETQETPPVGSDIQNHFHDLHDELQTLIAEVRKLQTEKAVSETTSDSYKKYVSDSLDLTTLCAGGKVQSHSEAERPVLVRS